MPPSSEVVLAALLLAAPPVVGSAPPGSSAPPALARLTFVERRVERSSEQGWHEAREGAPLVTALAGRFLVEGAGKSVALPAGTGTIVREGKPPLPPRALPEAPQGLVPGSDPQYVAPGDTVSLSWTPRGATHQVEVLPVGSD